MSKELKDLSKEEKEELVDKVNEDLANVDESSDGNTEIFTMNDIDPKAGETTPQQQYEKALTANSQALYAVDQIFSKHNSVKISHKNMKKLIIATLKLPEEGAVLKFGGTKDQQQMCEFAYAQMQLAANCRAFILGVNAMKEQRRAMKAKAEEEAKIKDKVNIDDIDGEELGSSIAEAVEDIRKEKDNE